MNRIDSENHKIRFLWLELSDTECHRQSVIIVLVRSAVAPWFVDCLGPGFDSMSPHRSSKSQSNLFINILLSIVVSIHEVKCVPYRVLNFNRCIPVLWIIRMEVSLDGLVLRSNIFSMQFIKVSVSVNVTVVSVTTGLFVLETFIPYFSKSVYTNGSDIDRFK